MEFKRKEKLSLTVKNRINVLLNFIRDRNIDAILLIFAYDSNNNTNILKCANWLLFGFSGLIEIEENHLPYDFNETFIIIYPNKVFIYSLLETRDYFYQAFSKVDNIEIDYYFPTKNDQKDTEKLQIIKISKFIEGTHFLNNVAIPLLPTEKKNIKNVEKWPLINATGFDVLGEGFFTLKHQILDISDDLDIIYAEYDITSIFDLAINRTKKLESTLKEFCMAYDNDPIDNRLFKSEEGLNEFQDLNFQYINYDQFKSTKYKFLNNLPYSRLLVGVNTNKDFTELSGHDALYKIDFDYKYPSFHFIYENFDPVTGIRIARTFFLCNMQDSFIDSTIEDEDKFELIKSKPYDDAFYIFNIYMLMIKKISEYQIDILNKKMEISNLVKEIINEVNNFIKEDVYDAFQHNNKNTLEFYLIKENQVDLKVQEYKIMKEFNINNYYNNRIIIIRAQISNIYSIKHNRLIGGVTYCNSFLKCFEEIFCLTRDVISTKFWFTSYLHYYNEKEMKYDIFNKIKKTQKKELDLKLSEIRYQGAIFYCDRYNIPLTFSDENFYSLNGEMWLLESYIYLNDKSLGPIIFSSDNIDEVAIKDDVKFLMIFIFFKEIDKLPLSGAVTGEFLIFIPSNQIKSNKSLIINYFKSYFSAGNIQGNNYTYSKVVNYISSFNDLNADYEKNNKNLEEIEKSVSKYIEYEYYLIKNKFKFLAFDEFQSFKKRDIETIEKKKKIKLIPVLGMMNSNIEYFTESLKEYIIKESKVNVSIIKLQTSELTNLENLSELVNSITKSTDNLLDTYYILEYQYEIPIYLFIDILSNQVKDFWNNYEIINICYALSFLCFIKNDNKGIFYNLKNSLNPDLCQVLFIDEGEVTSKKKELLSNQISSNGLIFNKRSFLMGSKDIKLIYSEKKFSRKVYDLIINSNLYQLPDFSLLNDEQIFIPFQYRIIRELFEDFLKENLCKRIYIKNLNLESESIKINPERNEKKGKFIMTDIDFQDELIRMVKDSKDSNYFIIEKLKCIQKFQNSPNLFVVKANYKLLDYQSIKEGNNTEFGFLLTGKNLKKYFCIIEKMIYNLCGGKIPNHIPYLTKKSLKEDEIERLNLVHLDDEIPDEWDRDGLIFVDKNDNRSAFHPRIDEFIEKYLEEQNQEIANKNSKIDEEIREFYLIN